jgi:hypothetical protein
MKNRLEKIKRLKEMVELNLITEKQFIAEVKKI